MFEATALEIRFKFLMGMCRQTSTLRIQLLNQGRVVFLYKLGEQSMLCAASATIFLGSPPLALPQ